MPYSAWIDIGAEREKSTNASPIVTVFGAGISGLSLAHELVERGFAVQVVESRADPEEERQCEVGGLAANQLMRTLPDASRGHPYLYPEPAGFEEPANGVPRSLQLKVVATGDEQLRVHVDGDDTTIATAGLSQAEIAEKIRAWADALSGVKATVAAGNDPIITLIADQDPYRVLRVRVYRDAGGGVSEASEVVEYEQAAHLGLLRGAAWQEAQRRHPITHRIQFERYGTTPWTDVADGRGIVNSKKLEQIWETLVAAYREYEPALDALLERVNGELEEKNFPDRITLSDRMRLREELLVELRGHTDDEQSEAQNRVQARAWAQLVRDWLVQRNVADGHPIPALAARIALIAVGSADPIGNPRSTAGRRRDNRVEVRIVENVLPGEHGYRYFPKFYRHLFDTMKRTPLLDRMGRETGDTAFDQLVPTPTIDIGISRDPGAAKGCQPKLDDDQKGARADESEDPERLPGAYPRSLEGVRHLLRIHLERLGICERDVIQFQFRLLRFLTASSERRKSWQDQSWWKFLGADDPSRYSERTRQLLRDTPQALVAMDAVETDARTQGLVYCQLLIDALTDGAESNRTLNGTTSEAWLRHWKRYLRRQGVRFFRGTLERLEWIQGRLLPIVTIDNGVGEKTEVVMVDPRTMSAEIQGQPIVFTPTPGTEELTEVAKQLAEVLRNDADLGLALPDPAQIVSPILPLRNRFERGSTAITIRDVGRQPVTIQATVNGREVDSGRPLEPGEARNALVDAFTRALREDRTGEFGVARSFGERSLVVQPVDGRAIVSVASGAPGRYGLWVEGVVVERAFPEPAPPEEIRDALLEELEKVLGRGRPPLWFGPLARTGIQLGFEDRRDATPTLVVHPWEGRLRVGLDVQLGEDAPAVRVPGGSVSVDSASANFGVSGAASEVDGEDFVAAPMGRQAASGGGPDFYVLALPYEEASRLVWEAWHSSSRPRDFRGVFEQLMVFDESTGRRTPRGANPADGQPIELVRDASGRPTPTHYPLRDLSGIQFYFENQVRIGQGHSYFIDSPWGLSSISQLAWWKERMGRSGAFLGQLSVDMGNWYRAFERVDPDSGEHRVHASAWRSTKPDIAREVWRQVLRGVSPSLEQKIVDPTWYHLDEAILFSDESVFAFGAPAVVKAVAGPALAYEMEVGGQTVSVAVGTANLSNALVKAVEDGTDHLAVALPARGETARFLVAPAARQVSEVRLAVLGDPIANAKYRVAVNLSTQKKIATYTAVAGDTLENVRHGIVAEVMKDLPGVVAEVMPQQEGEDVARGIRLYSTQPMTVSAVGERLAPKDLDEEASLLWMSPNGVTVIEPESRLELESPGQASVVGNRTPFLINTPDRIEGNQVIPIWDSRPGISLQAGHETEIFYEIEEDRWLMVGNHMATWTRLSTMESANESARHAVNAILHRLMAQDPDAPQPLYNGQGRLYGMVPEVWNPEDHELDDTLPFKRLDEKLMRLDDPQQEALPHFLDILKIGEWIDSLPPNPPSVPEDDMLQELLGFARRQLRLDWRFTQIDEVEGLLPAAIRAILGVEGD